MRQFFALFLALFIGVAVTACEESPAGIQPDSTSLMPSGHPAHGVVTVDANPDEGWIFNRDPNNVTPAGFSFDEAVLGSGSVHADPITNAGAVGNAAKFILEHFPDSPILVEDFGGFSIDFLIDDAGSNFDANQFYINVYTFVDPPNGTFFDCRFDYVADAGSTTAWTTLEVDATPTRVVPRNGTTCPSSLAGMPSGSTISFISVNIGDTSASDTGVGGYFDNALLTVDGSTTTFDFEPNCKDGGWESLTRPDGSSFKNQGQCVRHAKTGK